MSVADAQDDDDDFLDYLASTGVNFDSFYTEEFVDDSDSFYGPVSYTHLTLPTIYSV